MRGYLKTSANRESMNQAIKVGIVGVFNTVVSLSLFNVFRIAGLSILPKLAGYRDIVFGEALEEQPVSAS